MSPSCPTPTVRTSPVNHLSESPPPRTRIARRHRAFAIGPLLFSLLLLADEAVPDRPTDVAPVIDRGHLGGAGAGHQLADEVTAEGDEDEEEDEDDDDGLAEEGVRTGDLLSLPLNTFCCLCRVCAAVYWHSPSDKLCVMLVYHVSLLSLPLSDLSDSPRLPCTEPRRGAGTDIHIHSKARESNENPTRGMRSTYMCTSKTHRGSCTHIDREATVRRLQFSNCIR